MTAAEGVARMRRMKLFASAVFVAIAAAGLAGCAGGRQAEPRNLSVLKAELGIYKTSGRYDRDLSIIAAEAGRWIEERAAARAPGERLAVIFDIDETVLSNWALMARDDFGYISERWHAWVESAEAEAIPAVRETYRTAKRAGVAVIFLTGRKARDRMATELNLKRAGMEDYAELIVKPDAAGGGRAWPNAVAFKTQMRRELVARGWTIIANVGDQESDLAGGYAEKTFKLPNPFYITE